MVVLPIRPLKPRRPAARSKVDVHGIGKHHALPQQKFTLSIGAAKRKALANAAIGKYHAMAGNLSGAWIAVQRIAHVARTPRTAGEQRHLAVRGYHPLRDLLDYLVHLLKKPSDAIVRSFPRGKA